jgi:hypothetical protein
MSKTNDLLLVSKIIALILSVGVPTNRNEDPQKELAIKAPKAKERCRCGGWGYPPLGKTSL